MFLIPPKRMRNILLTWGILEGALSEGGIEKTQQWYYILILLVIIKKCVNEITILKIKNINYEIP